MSSACPTALRRAKALELKVATFRRERCTAWRDEIMPLRCYKADRAARYAAEAYRNALYTKNPARCPDLERTVRRGYALLAAAKRFAREGR